MVVLLLLSDRNPSPTLLPMVSLTAWTIPLATSQPTSQDPGLSAFPSAPFTSDVLRPPLRTQLAAKLPSLVMTGTTSSLPTSQTTFAQLTPLIGLETTHSLPLYRHDSPVSHTSGWLLSLSDRAFRDRLCWMTLDTPSSRDDQTTPADYAF